MKVSVHKPITMEYKKAVFWLVATVFLLSTACYGAALKSAHNVEPDAEQPSHVSVEYIPSCQDLQLGLYTTEKTTQYIICRVDNYEDQTEDTPVQCPGDLHFNTTLGYCVDSNLDCVCSSYGLMGPPDCCAEHTTPAATTTTMFQLE